MEGGTCFLGMQPASEAIASNHILTSSSSSQRGDCLSPCVTVTQFVPREGWCGVVLSSGVPSPLSPCCAGWALLKRDLLGGP